MQHLYTYTHKGSDNKSAYKTLFSFSAKLLLVIIIAFLVMMINMSKVSAEEQSELSIKKKAESENFRPGSPKSTAKAAL